MVGEGKLKVHDTACAVGMSERVHNIMLWTGGRTSGDVRVGRSWATALNNSQILEIILVL